MQDSSQNGGFLFATFKSGATPFAEQVYFGLSENGREWTALNGAEPALLSQVGERGARDPFLVRSPDASRCWIIATDLNIHLNPDWGRAVKQGSRSILVWESSDLVDWVGPRLVEIAAPDAGCTWAPEAIWDPTREEFLVFWASTTASDGFSKHRIWAAWTPNFESFSEPFIWIDKPHHVIDTNIVRQGDTYFRFSKDEKNKSITLESSQNLLGEWHNIPHFSLAQLQRVEGPLCFRLIDGSWCLLLDFFASGQGYKAFVTADLAEGQWEAANDFIFPFRFRHGGILPVTRLELERIKASI